MSHPEHSGPLRVAIDAANLVRDRRGMGRLARTTIRAGSNDPRYRFTLLADRRGDVRALRAEFGGLDVRGSSSARRDGRYDVVWFPFNGMRYTVTGPALVVVHDVFAFTEPHPERIARFREQAPIRRGARAASQLVTISEWSRFEIARELAVPLERIAVVAPVPDPFWFPANGDVVPAPLRDQRYALVVGARESRKNVRLAIAACARALRGERETLVVVGTLSAADRAFALDSGVRAGEIAASDAVLRALYRNAAVVLVPSLAEAFGLVAAEATACGAPVLAADAAALPETTAGAATLLDPRDAGLWAREIRSLLDDESKTAALRERSAARFASVDRDAPPRRMLALLADVARRSPRS